MKNLIFFCISLLFILLNQENVSARNINTFKKPLFDISKNIQEVSGTVFDPKRNALWSIGDSGNGNRTKLAYTDISKNWKTKTIQVLNSQNIDWEAIVMDRDSDRIFILDIGDNQKDRKFIYAYEINPNDILENNTVSYLKKYKIKFTPPSAFNVEAAFIKDGHLYLVEKATFKAAKIFEVNLQLNSRVYYAEWYATLGGFSSLITDAEVHYETGEIYLLSYLGIYKLINFYNPVRIKTIPIKPSFWGQVETLGIINNNQFILAQEKGIFFRAL